LFERCGNPLQPSYSLPKLLWYKAHWPEAYGKATGVLQCNGYVVLRLTGERTQDVSQGYGFQCFDMHTARWDAASVREFGIPPEWLPEPMPCHAVAGTVTPEAARLTGLIPGTPVVAGGLDAACGTLGAGVFEPGQTQEQGGQAGGMSICLDEYRADPRLILSRHVVPDRFLLQGGTVGGGGALRWFAEQFCQAEASRGPVFERMSEEAGDIAPGADGLIFLPY
ncbi:MAG TPA: FGGY family carbohydrate kinase, partial [Clostridia bacterium]|nr:FGGY family carbohydrate kinase [Clostridia bacterium]